MRVFTLKRLMLLPVAAAALVSSSVFAAEDVIPPLTGEGASETYMQAIWVMIIFVIVLAILYPTAWKNVLAGLKKREDKIRGDIADAEAARARAELTLKQYNDQLASAEGRVREMIATATAQGEKVATALRMQAQQEGEEAKQRAMKDIDAARDAALREIYEQTANLSTAIAEKIIRRNLNAADQQALVQESLAQLQTAAK